MKIIQHYSDLIEAGYKQYGNWYIRDGISINLANNTIKLYDTTFLESKTSLLGKLNLEQLEFAYYALNSIKSQCN